MRKYISILLTIFLLQACKKEHDSIQPAETYSTKLDGKYKLLTIYSTVPVDINRDSTFSTDLMVEIPIIKDSVKYFLELSTTQYNIPYQIIDQWVPRPGAFFDSNGKFIKVEYSFTNLNSRYGYDEKTNKIKIIPYSMGIISAELSEKNKITITSTYTYYTSNGWEPLTMVATYIKK